MTHQPIVWCSKYYFFFFIISCKILSKNRFNYFFYSYKFTKIKVKSFECPKFIRNYKKNNAWNIRHLVHRPSVLYCRLTDLRTTYSIVNHSIVVLISVFTSWLDFLCCQNIMDNCYFLKKFFGTILTEDLEEQCFCKNEDMYCLLIYLCFFFQISVCGWLLTMISWGLVMVTLPFSLFVCFKVGHFYITTFTVFTFNPKKILWSFFFGGLKLIWFSGQKSTK